MEPKIEKLIRWIDKDGQPNFTIVAREELDTWVAKLEADGIEYEVIDY